MYQPTAQPASVDPIISRLRPRTVGEILDQAFRLYRKYFLTFVAIIAVVVVPLQLAQQTVTALFIGNLTSYTNGLSSGNATGSSSSTTYMNQLFSSLGVFYAVLLGLGIATALLQSLSQAALTGEVANSYQDKPVSFGDSYRQMFSRIGPLLGSIFLQLGIDLLILLPVVLLFILTFSISLNSASSSSGGSTFFALFCFSCLLIIPAFVLLIYVLVRLYIITPIIMVERLGPVQALRRSWELVRNYWWRTFALVLVLGILGYIIQIGPALLLQSIVSIFTPRDLVTQQLVSGLVTVFTTVIFVPVQLTAVTLYYFDLRVRKEGYDIEAALNQRYTTPPSLPTAWAGAGAASGYGQPAPTTPVLPPPSLGQDSYGYNYGYGGYNYPKGAPTQPTGGEQLRSAPNTSPLPAPDDQSSPPPGQDVER